MEDNLLVLVFAFLFSASELLGYSQKVKANGVFQVIFGVVKAVYNAIKK